MTIIVAASDEQWETLASKRTTGEWLRVKDGNEFINCKTADAFFNLTASEILPVYALLKKPVFINAVIPTLRLLNAPNNVFRISGWPGFLQRATWEIAGPINENIKTFFENIGIKVIVVADEPGLIAARIIAMIINEAYLALADEVSTKNEIDTAMKLGTNYPYGPFEWGNTIGLQPVLELLQELSIHDKRYQPAGLLIKEVKEKA